MSPFIEGGWAKQIGSSKGQSLTGKVLSNVGLVDVAPSVRGAETAAGACASYRWGPGTRRTKSRREFLIVSLLPSSGYLRIASEHRSISQSPRIPPKSRLIN